jgi:hypothetical protein
MIQNDQEKANDMIGDHNKVEQQLSIQYTLKITRLVVVILMCAYLLGMMWFIMVRLIEDFTLDESINLIEEGTDGLPFI